MKTNYHYGIFNRTLVKQILSFKARLRIAEEKNSKTLYLEASVNKGNREILQSTLIDNQFIDDIRLFEIRPDKFLSTDLEISSLPSSSASEIIKDRTLVFRFFVSGCNTCITATINKLNSFSKRIGIEKVILIPDSYNISIGIQLASTSNKNRLFCTNNAMLLPEIDETRASYIFICESDLRITKPFILTEETLAFLETYLGMIEKTFNKPLSK